LRLSTASRFGIALLLLVVWAAAGCSRKPAPPPKPPTRDTRAPGDVVKAYLNALESKQYRDAYQALTADSRSRHSLAEFERAAGEAGPVYDLDRIEVHVADVAGPEEAHVSVGIAEDPAVQTFTLRREDQAWRIVFKSGSPAAPNPQ
jgi:hypothetical protein